MSWEWVSWYQSTAEYGGDPALSSTGVRESQEHDRIAAIGQEMKRKNRALVSCISKVRFRLWSPQLVSYQRLLGLVQENRGMDPEA